MNGIITIIINAGSISIEFFQFNFSILLNIKTATYTSAPEVAYGGTIAASGDKKIAKIKNNPTMTETMPVFPPDSTPAELSI